MVDYRSFIDEASLARVYDHTKNRNIALLTAQSHLHDPATNISRNRELEGDIRKAGYGFIHVKGRYVQNFGTPEATPVDEHSYMVVGKEGDDNGSLLGFARQMGRKYGQESILHKAYHSDTAQLHRTDGSEWGSDAPGNSVEGKPLERDIGHWHPNRVKEFQSVLRNGRTFDFGEGVLENVQFIRPKSFFRRDERPF